MNPATGRPTVGRTSAAGSRSAPAWHTRASVRVAAVLGAVFLVLSVLVVANASLSTDERIRDRARPDEVWGTPQQLLNPVIDGIDPPRVFTLLAVVALVVAWRRSSVWPLLFAGCVVFASVGSTMLVKFAVSRPDPRTEMTAVGGSYPSGHLLAAVVCLGGCLLLLTPRTRWWQWVLVALVGGSMGTALVFTAAHWFTDVLGGVLLAAALLCVLSALPWRSAVFRGSGPAPRRRREPT